MIVRIMMDSHGIVSPISPLITILPIRTKYKARNFFIRPAIRLRITKKAEAAYANNRHNSEYRYKYKFLNTMKSGDIINFLFRHPICFFIYMNMCLLLLHIVSIIHLICLQMRILYRLWNDNSLERDNIFVVKNS